MNVTVGKGDTLYKMLREQGVPENRLGQVSAEVVKLNGLKSANEIKPGLTLQFPDSFEAAPKMFPGQMSVADEFKGRSPGEEPGLMGGLLGVLGANRASQIEGEFMEPYVDLDYERMGKIYSTTFWGDAQGIHGNTSKLNFHQDGTVHGWRIVESDEGAKRIPIEGTYNRSKLENDADHNPARLEIKTTSGEIIRGQVALMQDGSIKAAVEGLSPLGTEADQSNEAINPLVTAPLFGGNGGAYGHRARFDFDPDGSVKGWHLHLDPETDHIKRKPFEGSWELGDDGKVIVTFDEPVRGQNSASGTLTPEGGLDLWFDNGIHFTTLNQIEDPWEFYDA